MAIEMSPHYPLSGQLPLSATKFAELREKDQLYIDKTDMVAQIAWNNRKYALFRPRRFGKSLLVSTFESLFRDGLKNFHGLKIANLWNDETYDVVRLDFSSIRRFVSVDQYEKDFRDFLVSSFRKTGFKYDPTDVLSVTYQLSSWLESRPAGRLVLLVDEYDAPLTDAMNDPETFDYIRGVLADFYAKIKQNQGALRFFFLTGIAKFQNANIFSELNDVIDLSLRPEYGTLLGFTKEEIESYFATYVQRAADRLGMTAAEVMDQLTEHYDGYCFERTATKHVYSPWSVLNFLDDPSEGFANYWYSSAGEATVLMRYLKAHRLAAPEHYAEPLAVSYDTLYSPKSLASMPASVLLTQTGYLTIRSVTSNGVFFMGYPNEEVAQSMAWLYATMCLKNPDESRARMSGLVPALAAGDARAVVDLFNAAFACIDYMRSPVESEAACRSHLQVLLIGACLLPSVEVHGAQGRSDLEVTAGRHHWVFEFKFLPKSAGDSEDSALQLLAEAKGQLQGKGYLDKTLDAERTIGAALVFSAARRQIVAWERVPPLAQGPACGSCRQP